MLHADESGWHFNGVLVWLWCFCTGRETFYAIEESRGQDVRHGHFVEAFEGVLVTDFYRPDNAVNARMNQTCWAHLLRELQAVEDRPDGSRDDGLDFAKRLRRMCTDAVRLAAAGDVVSQTERDSEGSPAFADDYWRRGRASSGRPAAGEPVADGRRVAPDVRRVPRRAGHEQPGPSGRSARQW